MPHIKNEVRKLAQGFLNEIGITPKRHVFVDRRVNGRSAVKFSGVTLTPKRLKQLKAYMEKHCDDVTVSPAREQSKWAWENYFAGIRVTAKPRARVSYAHFLKLNDMDLYTVYCNSGRYDQNYLVYAKSAAQAKKAVDKVSDAKVRNADRYTEDDLINMFECYGGEMPDLNNLRETNDPYLYDEGT